MLYGGAGEKSNEWVKCLVAALVAALIAVMVTLWYYSVGYFAPKTPAKFMPYRRFDTINTNAFKGAERTDPTGSMPRGVSPVSMTPDAVDLMFKYKGLPSMNVGGSSCYVSPTNNCPPDLGYTCSKPGWSDDAAGELLGLSATGAFGAPSLREEPTLNRLVDLAFDTVDKTCADADVGGQYAANLAKAGVGSPSSFRSRNFAAASNWKTY